MRERLSPTFVHSLHALQSARTAGWLTTYEFEEELLRLFTHGASAAAPTSTTPSPADSTSGDLGAQVATATAKGTEFFCDPSSISPRDVLGTQVPTNSTTAHPVDHVVRVQGAVMIETLPESPTMLQGPSRGLCSAQTSGSPMTLNSASAAGSASKADVNLECVEAGQSIQAPGPARDIAPALGAPSNAISNPNPKQTHPGDMQLQVIITRLPITPDDRITVPESEVGILLQDLDKKRAPRSLPRPRPGSKRARRTLTLPRDAVDLVTARQPWDPGPWHDYANEDAHAFNFQALTATQWRTAPKRSTTMDSEGGTSTKQTDFGPFDDANSYYGEQDCADAFDDNGLSAWYFDQG